MTKKQASVDGIGKNKNGGPIARKVIAALEGFRGSTAVDLAAYRTGRANAKALQETAATREELADLDPAHALYVHVQNTVSVLVEELTALPDLSRFANLIVDAQEEYLPSGPPMSPLTTSYFTCWAFFDLAVGRSRETLGTCIMEVGRELDMEGGLLDIIKVMQESRMGIFIHEGSDQKRTVLRELVTDERRRCIILSGYSGKPGEIWLARVLPPPLPAFEYSIVFTTPYVIRSPGERAWNEYFDRVLRGATDRRSEYEAFMKYGPERHYWNEYILEGYVDDVPEAIFLKGMPDVATSRPHSRENRETRNEP